MNLICEGVVKVKLRRELVSLLGLRIGADLEVDVNGPALVPAGVDSLELGASTVVCHLVPA